MSIEAIGYVFTLNLPATEKWLLVCLANYADKTGESIYPQLETLEADSGMSRSTLKRAFHELIERGVLERLAESSPVSPAFYRIVGVPEPKEFKSDPSCPPVLRRAVIHAFSNTCEYCKRSSDSKDNDPDGKTWHVDRVVPGLRGGVYAPDNVTLACRFCNLKKKANPAPDGTRTLTEVLGVKRSVQLERSYQRLLEKREAQAEPSERPPGTLGGFTVASDPSLDPGSDPSKDSAGAPPPRPRQNPEPERPERNIRVITKIAHEAIEQLGTHHEDLVETVKSLCAKRDIRYNSAVVLSALDSARWQRTHPNQEVH
jgi:hypothetical protein